MLKNKLTISSWNVHGLFYREDGNRYCKLNDPDFCENINSDIICLLETKADKDDNLCLKGYTLLKKVARPRKGKAIHGGIALYARTNVSKGITLIKGNSSEFLWAKLSKTCFSHSSDIFVCFAYNSPIQSSYSKSLKSELTTLEKIEQDLSKFSNSGETIIMGDLNAHINENDLDFISSDHVKSLQDILPNSYLADNVQYRRYCTKKNIKTDEYGKRVLELCISSRSRILNGRTLGDTLGKPTSHQYNGSAVVDYCIVSNNMLKNVCFFTVKDFTVHSDHCPINVCLSLNFSQVQQKVGRPIPKGLHWNNEVQKCYTEMMLSKEVESNVKSFLSKDRVPQRNGVDEATEDLTDIFNNILDKLRSHLNLPKGNRFKSKKRKRKKSSLGFDSECESMYRNLIQSSRSLSKGSVNEEKLKNYYGLKKQFKKLVRKKTRQYKAKMLDSLLELEDKNPKAYWDIINKFKYSDKDISDQSSNIPSDEWYNYFNKLLNVDCSNEQDDFPTGFNVFLDYDIHMQEVLKAIKSLKNNTSVGFDCISNEMLKHSSVNMLNCICKLFNIILKSTLFPSSWTESMIKPLFKSGDVRDPSNYREILSYDLNVQIGNTYSILLNPRNIIPT
ncbi:unnamed protein product [Mytilus edulis]|uniref:Endonuclease/exonuclease/phosphatase domain-containing protein n=1 Tax=Mytilus edulis TaxID=6550 RepID=A0A8S3QFF6_MYTED|nr:unnamed protein product [Mytilus edulis]